MTLRTTLGQWPRYSLYAIALLLGGVTLTHPGRNLITAIWWSDIGFFLVRMHVIMGDKSYFAHCVARTLLYLVSPLMTYTTGLAYACGWDYWTDLYLAAATVGHGIDLLIALWCAISGKNRFQDTASARSQDPPDLEIGLPYFEAAIWIDPHYQRTLDWSVE